jgi:glucose/arabinose dehydrogenase/mono/diheme cytochrome c family protein
MSRAMVFALQLFIVVVAVLLGAEMASRVSIIPKSLLHLPQVDFSADDIRTVLLAFLVACGVSFLANRFINGWEPFAEPRRAAKEVYALLVGIVAAALYLFFLTAINFSPELLLDSSLIAFALFLLTFAAVGLWRQRGARVGSFLGNLFGLLKSPWAWLVVLFALSPIVVARQFTTDRDFANWVTNVRVAANVGGDHPYELVNALGSTRFETPIMAQFADSDPNRIYVLTRNGQLWRAEYPSGANSVMLLDIAGKVGFVEMENGALGFDLHPDFGRAGSPNAGFAYIYFTEYREDGQTNHLTRYDLSAGDPAAVVATATPLIAQGRNNDGYHNGGSVEFGPDGFLYLAVGESSSRRCHQRIDCSLYGGILRLDVDRKGGSVSRPIARQPENGQTANYYIPLDNPYVGDPKALGEFWAHGLRNPFRISFDPQGGTLWAGEVGSTVWEEVNRIERGGNYQFPYIEGAELQKSHPRPARIVGTEKTPVLTYKHTAYLRSVIGGTVYRGARLPELRSKYVFSDNYSGEIMAIPAAAPTSDKWEVIARARDVAQRGLTALVVAPDGNLLAVVMGDNDKPTGTVSRLVKADSAEAQQAREAAEAEEAARIAAAPAGGAGGAKASTISSAQARSLFNVNCARCHGAGGKGDGPDSQELGAHVPDLTDANFHKWRTDAEILAVLKGGGPAVGQSPMMPPWEGVLSDAEMVAMKDYVRALKGTAPSE